MRLFIVGNCICNDNLFVYYFNKRMDRVKVVHTSGEWRIELDDSMHQEVYIIYDIRGVEIDRAINFELAYSLLGLYKKQS